jgi:putative tricarboxylic transport membrane protein
MRRRARPRLNGDVLAGAALGALGTYVATRSLDWEVMGMDGPGPGFFPLGYGLLMVALSVLLVLRALYDGRPRDDRPGAAGGEARALLTWAAFTGAAAAMQWAGFVLAFAALSAFVVAHVFRGGWRRAAAVGTGCAAGFWLVFTQLLGVALPAGPWGF